MLKKGEVKCRGGNNLQLHAQKMNSRMIQKFRSAQTMKNRKFGSSYAFLLCYYCMWWGTKILNHFCLFSLKESRSWHLKVILKPKERTNVIVDKWTCTFLWRQGLSFKTTNWHTWIGLKRWHMIPSLLGRCFQDWWSHIRQRNKARKPESKKIKRITLS